MFYRAGEYFEHRAVEKSRSQIMEAVDLRPEVVERVLGEFVFLSQGKVIRQGNTDETREETGKSLDELFREVFRCLEN